MITKSPYYCDTVKRFMLPVKIIIHPANHHLSTMFYRALYE